MTFQEQFERALNLLPNQSRKNLMVTNLVGGMYELLGDQAATNCLEMALEMSQRGMIISPTHRRLSFGVTHTYTQRVVPRPRRGLYIVPKIREG